MVSLDRHVFTSDCVSRGEGNWGEPSELCFSVCETRGIHEWGKWQAEISARLGLGSGIGDQWVAEDIIHSVKSIRVLLR